ncbi:MAG: hypothetical protein WB439_04585 [Acidobacteriaceae bacterium]
MTLRKGIASAIVALGMIGTALAAQAPVQDINPSHHPNLAQAQRLVGEAFQHLETAQRANHDRLGGHAEKAKHLLDQANMEIKLAAESADHH